MLPCHRDLGMMLLTLALVTLHFTMRCLAASQAAIASESPSLRKERLILRQEVHSSGFFFHS